ncbi:MAG: ABC transporter ATP-binding protein [Pirellula sp.]|jgi:putative ABC transport system ATP-binding protein|nr:ABC transporter ATP-binding protein [Pirellula sp.]
MSVICKGVKMAFKTNAGSVDVLKGVDFAAPAGMLSMLVGPSGCGKTTLISLIAGLLRGASGSMQVFGHDVASMNPAMLISFRLRNIGFIFQQYNLLAGLTASENVAVPLIANGFTWPDALSKSRSMLEKLGLTAHVDKLPSQLSGGQQQRVAIARALVHGPKLLLCDEPTAALDGQSGQAVMSLLRELAVAPDRAAVVVTHDPRVYGFADQVVHMEDGLITRIETTAKHDAKEY